MSDNQGCRRRLEHIFGKICMIEALGIRNIPKEQRKKIRGYKKYDDIITYHHIKERHLGGRTTEDNGALLKGYNHKWLHSLSEEDKYKVNDSIIQFKAAIIQANSKGIDIKQEPISITFEEEDTITIPLLNNTKEDNEKRIKFNRAKIKRDTNRLIDEELYGGDSEYER